MVHIDSSSVLPSTEHISSIPRIAAKFVDLIAENLDIASFGWRSVPTFANGKHSVENTVLLVEKNGDTYVFRWDNLSLWQQDARTYTTIGQALSVFTDSYGSPRLDDDATYFLVGELPLSELAKHDIVSVLYSALSQITSYIDHKTFPIWHAIPEHIEFSSVIVWSGMPYYDIIDGMVVSYGPPVRQAGLNKPTLGEDNGS